MRLASLEWSTASESACPTKTDLMVPWWRRRFRLPFLATIALVHSFSAFGQDLSGARIRAHVKFLASDLLEGRGVGTRGGELATEYIASQLALAGAKPAGDNGTYFQRVPLAGVEPQPDSKLEAESKGRVAAFKWLDDFVGNTLDQKTLNEFDVEAVFVGHGITAPEFQWDDYKGVDVRGKIVVLFTNEPPSDDPKFFGGKALTYYGRWSYKYEQALRKGALGCIIVHTDGTAGYGWDVVRNSWSKEDAQVKLAPGQRDLAIAGWVTREAGGRLFGLAGKTVDEMLKAADTRGFKASALNLRLRGRMQAKVRSIESANVAGIFTGTDPQLKSEAVVFSAHWDHLGIGLPVNGDSIYNGAVDNASGCAIVLEIARAWGALAHKPRRSALFLWVTAEESGLRGSEYYASHPLIAPGKTALGLNFDAFYPFGRTSDVVVEGSERTTAYPLVEEAARRYGLRIKPDAHPEQGHFYRSDHFSFAKVGIPAFSINMGSDYAGKQAGFGQKQFEEFNTKNYHQPSDEYKDSWDMSGMEQMAQFGYTLGLNAANTEMMPTWKKGDEFLSAREKSGVK
jgi:Zn-dependent M28 family amino/carboxypeptidase